MPIHDWTRTDSAASHDMHLSWMAALRMPLNRGFLPAGFYGQIASHHASNPLVHAEPSKGRQRTIGLFRETDRRLVAVVEQTTRQMLATPHELADSRDRIRARIRLGVHTLVINIHPPTPDYSPDTFYDLAARIVTQGEGELVVSSFDANGGGVVVNMRFTVHDDIPSPPLRLSENHTVVLPLQQSYDAAFAGVAPHDQETLTRSLPGGTPSPTVR